jgi:hypothetical protein
MLFLIQTVNGKIKHDFSFALLEAIDYHKWLDPKADMTYLLTDDDWTSRVRPYKQNINYIPIGSVEFVRYYLVENGWGNPKPKNIPEDLLPWAGRTVINGTEKDIIGEKFVKSNDMIKSFAEICTEAPPGNYQISDVIEIESEWRAFVYQGKLVGLQNYSGEFDIFPDVHKIWDMIKAYKSQPVAYTLDVALSNGNTVIMEVHDFFSCGLYGFSDLKILPFMFSKWFYEYTKGSE